MLETVDVPGERPLRPIEMQVLVTLALGESPAGEAAPQTDLGWLSRTLALEEWIAEQVVAALVRTELVRAWPPERADVEDATG